MKTQSSKHPILVPVDFSDHSRAALLYAIPLADCLSCPLLVLHVVHDPGEMPGYYSRALKAKQMHRIEDGAAEMLEQFLGAIAKKHLQPKLLKRLSSMLVTGLPVTRILEVADQKQACLIVLGSKGLSGIRHLFMGSVSERIVHLSPIPVTVVKTAGLTQ